jgi:hypothetical protein
VNHATMPLEQIEALLAEPLFTYEDFVDSVAGDCRCPDQVCAGVLAGGFCDSSRLTWPGLDAMEFKPVILEWGPF